MEMLCLEMEMLCLCLGPCLGTLAGILVSWILAVAILVSEILGILTCLGSCYAFPTFAEWMQGSSLPGPIQ